MVAIVARRRDTGFSCLAAAGRPQGARWLVETGLRPRRAMVRVNVRRSQRWLRIARSRRGQPLAHGCARKPAPAGRERPPAPGLRAGRLPHAAACRARAGETIRGLYGAQPARTKEPTPE